jgi:ureidoglycolate lyase
MAHRVAPVLADPFKVYEAPVIAATPASLKGYGALVDDFATAKIEIVRWPAQGWRAVDPDTGDQGGTTEGTFSFWWQGEVLYGRNEAVGDSYLIGWSRDPREASEQAAPGSNGAPARAQALVWHVNYHPDGGQLFFPKESKPFLIPLALPGDDLKPEKFVAFWCDGSKGLYIHPGVWHEGVIPLAAAHAFDDRQGRVHARVSCNLVKEFGGYLGVPLRAP